MDYQDFGASSDEEISKVYELNIRIVQAVRMSFAPVPPGVSLSPQLHCMFMKILHFLLR